MTRWPTTFDSHVCATPITPVNTETPIMPSTSRVSRPVSRWGMAVSSTARSRNGETTPRPEDRKISASSDPRRSR